MGISFEAYVCYGASLNNFQIARDSNCHSSSAQDINISCEGIKRILGEFEMPYPSEKSY